MARGCVIRRCSRSPTKRTGCDAGALAPEGVAHPHSPKIKKAHTITSMAPILWLDVDCVEAILRRGGLDAAGRLSATCTDLKTACEQLLLRVGALTEWPLNLLPQEVFGADSRVLLRCEGTGMGNAGLGIVARACASGALASCAQLYLNHSSVGDEGIAVLADACGRGGALQKLVRLSLIGNQIGDKGLEALAWACAHDAALPVLWDLWLSGNRIGCAGATALGKACTEGALAEVTTLTLGQNQIGDVGVEALAAALARGALPRLGDLGVDCFNGKLMDACASRDMTLSLCNPVVTLSCLRPVQSDLHDGQVESTDESEDESEGVEVDGGGGGVGWDA